MSMKYTFSYIIPYRKSTTTRERNLKMVINWVTAHFDNCEIIIVEMASQPSLIYQSKDHDINHIFIKDYDVFNRSKARNIGALNAQSDILVFADNDVIMQPGILRECVAKCNEFDAVNPFNLFIDLSESDLIQYNLYQNDFHTLFRHPLQTVIKSEDYYRQNLNFACGIFAIKKNAFFSIGGWPEEIQGWGAEDDIISYKIDRFLDSITLINNIFHLPHERQVFDSRNHPYFQLNCEIMNKIFKLNDHDLINYCMKSRERILTSEHCAIATNEITRINSLSNSLLKNIRNNDNLDIAVKSGDGVAYYPLRV